jgi:N utilization substance protein B
MQALYQWQVAGQPAADIIRQFAGDEEHARCDDAYFRALVEGAISQHEALDRLIAEYSDRAIAQLDPVEHGILLIGVYELQERCEVPYRVVINEAVALCRSFGAEDGHKFVNALLDRAARRLRSPEVAASG